jgi:hypothetical protein
MSKRLLRRDARMPRAQDALERLLLRDARMPPSQDALERPNRSPAAALSNSAGYRWGEAA